MTDLKAFFQQVANASGFDILPATRNAALVRAMLANFETGLTHGHISRESATTYFTGVALKAEALIASSRPMTGLLDVDQILRAMLVVLEDQRAFFLRAPPPARYMDKQAVTVQSHYRLADWFGFSHRELAQGPYETTIKRLVDAARDRAKQRAGVKLVPEDEVLWLTPYDGEVKDQVVRARMLREFNANSDAAATRLRELLGLVRRHPGDYLFAVVTKRKIEQFPDQQQQYAKAPTVFESCGYERFRHWPPVNGSDPDHVGRTYDLNPTKRLSVRLGHHGVPEIVCKPLLMGDVEPAIYLGAIAEADDLDYGPRGWQARLEADREFAEEISAGRSVEMLSMSLREMLS